MQDLATIANGVTSLAVRLLLEGAFQGSLAESERGIAAGTTIYSLPFTAEGAEAVVRLLLSQDR